MGFFDKAVGFSQGLRKRTSSEGVHWVHPACPEQRVGCLADGELLLVVRGSWFPDFPAMAVSTRIGEAQPDLGNTHSLGALMVGN